MVITILLFIGSLLLLIIASNYFLDSSEKIGISYGISPFVIGITIVAMGTSLPELTTSIVSVMAGSSEIVVGNVVGSNITNILLVIGLTTLISGSFNFDRNILKTDFPLLMGSALLLWFVLKDNVFSRFESVIFMLGFIGFVIFSIQKKGTDEFQKKKVGLDHYFILIISGLGVYYGATFTVESVGKMAQNLGVNPAIISLSVLALGTSLPEVVVSITAFRKGMHMMAIGNIIGSNLFNTFAVMAIPSFFGALSIPPEIMSFSLPFMVVVTVLFGLISYGRKITTWEAGLLLVFYIYFLAELIQLGFVN